MRVGIPREIKNQEHRVAATPAGVRALVDGGHEVRVETRAGEGSSLPDEAYQAAGAKIVPAAGDAWDVDLVLKVKEPVGPEIERLRPGLTLFTFLHLAATRELTQALLDRRVRSFAYEMVTDRDGRLPLLRPMSEIAGRLSIQAGARCLEKEHGGRGLLLSGVPGTRRGHVLVLGAGVVGCAATRLAIGLEARVTVLDVAIDPLRRLEHEFGAAAEYRASTPDVIAEQVPRADLIIGAVLVPGGEAPQLVSREQVASMTPGSAIVDVAVDQGGCIETSRPTTHDDPTYVEEGVVHYCVANMPGTVPETSTQALTNETLAPALVIANQGPERAVRHAPQLAAAVQTWDGTLTCPAVADAHRMDWSGLAELGLT